MARLISALDTIEVTNPPCLIYGQPFSGKTTLAQLTEKPLTLDTDGGIQRTQHRKDTLCGEDAEGKSRPLSWMEIMEEEQRGTFKPFKTLVIDTVGHLLDSLITVVIQERQGTNGTLDKGPSPQGWGVVKNRFGAFVKRQRAQGKQIVFVCHEKEKKEGKENVYLRPAIVGGSYDTIMEVCDLLGRLSFRGNKRLLDFSPTEEHFGKNPAYWAAIEVPDANERPTFLKELIDEAARFMSTTVEASRAIAAAVQEWQKRLEADPSIDELNAMLPNIGDLQGAAKKQAWHLVKDFAGRAGLTWDQAIKRWVKGVAA